MSLASSKQATRRNAPGKRSGRLSPEKYERERMQTLNKLRKILSNQAKNFSGIPNELLHEERGGSGFIFGKTRSLCKELTVAKPLDKDGHILVVGGSGSGKSSSMVKPTLEACDTPFFALDVNGELCEHMSETSQLGKRPTKIINLTDDEGEFSTYDLFNAIKTAGEKNVCI